MKIKEMPELKILNECFMYDVVSGKLFWKIRPLHHFESEHTYNIFCSRNSGKEVGWTSPQGYLKTKINGIQYHVHRVIWKMVNNVEPREIDHINGNRSDNRLENLRDVVRSENGKNKGKPTNNTSGVKGVSYHTRDQCWQAFITCDGKRHYLGYFNTKEEAISSRITAEESLFKQFRRNNCVQ